MMEPTYNNIQLRVKGLPSQWKNVNFEDRKYVTGERFYKIDSSVTEYETDEAYKSLDFKNIFFNHKILTYKYERYIFEIDSTEEIGIDEIQAGEEVLVIDEERVYYQCKVDNIEYINHEKTSLYQIKVTLQVIYKYDGEGANKDNILTENFVNDFVTKNYIRDKYNREIVLRLYNYETINNKYIDMFFYTKFYPKKIFVEDVLDKTTLANGREIINKKQGWECLVTTFYVTEEEKINLEKYGNLCFYKTSTGLTQGNLLSTPEDDIYVSQKPILIEFEENTDINNYDIYKCKITMYIDKVNYSPNLNLNTL